MQYYCAQVQHLFVPSNSLQEEVVDEEERSKCSCESDVGLTSNDHCNNLKQHLKNHNHLYDIARVLFYVTVECRARLPSSNPNDFQADVNSNGD